MSLGVTYAGEVGRVGAGSTPQETVELICTDPNFVEAASAKKPNFILRLFNGALSFPRDWWYGATFLSTRAYVFATDGRSATDASANTATELLLYAWNNRVMALRTIRAVLGHLIHYPEFWGRSGAQLGVGAAVGALTRSPRATIAVGVLNFIIATTGTVIRAIDNGASTFAEIVIAAGIGYSDPELAQRVAQELSIPSPADGDYDIPSEEEDYIIEVLEGVLHCVRNPETYMRSDADVERRGGQSVVPVGTVSSARPRGVMGNIPVGYETNALDVISDNQNMLRSGGGGSSW